MDGLKEKKKQEPKQIGRKRRKQFPVRADGDELEYMDYQSKESGFKKIAPWIRSLIFKKGWQENLAWLRMKYAKKKISAL